MEGLIPYIYRSVKRSRTSQRFSSGAAQWSLGGGSSSFKIPRPPLIKLGGVTEEQKAQPQRRHRSMDLDEDLPAGGKLSSPESPRRQSPLAAKDAGSRGSARFLACIGGGGGGA